MFIRQITPLGFLICSVIVVACSSNTNSAGLPMRATSIDAHLNGWPMYKKPPAKGWQFLKPNPFVSQICPSDPCSPKLDSASASEIKQMMNGSFSMGVIQVAKPGTAGGHAESDEVPIYYAKGDDPAYSVTCTEPYTPRCGRLFPKVPTPNGAYASADSDHHASVIVQLPAQTYEYDFWEFNCYAKASRFAGKPKGKCTGTTVPVSGGGTVYVSYGSACDANSFAGGGTCHGTAVAAGVPTQPGLLDPRELSAAQIKHVLYVAVGCPSGEYVWPADRSALPLTGIKQSNIHIVH